MCRFGVFLAAALAAPAAAAADRPNVVVVLTDDQGWGDLGINGNTNLATPHLDSLAKAGGGRYLHLDGTQHLVSLRDDLSRLQQTPLHEHDQRTHDGAMARQPRGRFERQVLVAGNDLGEQQYLAVGLVDGAPQDLLDDVEQFGVRELGRVAAVERALAKFGAGAHADIGHHPRDVNLIHVTATV